MGESPVNLSRYVPLPSPRFNRGEAFLCSLQRGSPRRDFAVFLPPDEQNRQWGCGGRSSPRFRRFPSSCFESRLKRKLELPGGGFPSWSLGTSGNRRSSSLRTSGNSHSSAFLPPLYSEKNTFIGQDSQSGFFRQKRWPVRTRRAWNSWKKSTSGSRAPVKYSRSSS